MEPLVHHNIPPMPEMLKVDTPRCLDCLDCVCLDCINIKWERCVGIQHALCEILTDMTASAYSFGTMSMSRVDPKVVTISVKVECMTSVSH